MIFFGKALFLYSYVLGFLFTSFILRYIFRHLRRKNNSILILYLQVFIIVFFFVPIWYYVVVFTSMLFWEPVGIHNFIKKLTLLNFFRINYTMYLTYYGWTALYFGIKYMLELQEEKSGQKKHNIWHKKRSSKCCVINSIRIFYSIL